MLRRAVLLKSGPEDDNGDSGAETAGSDCSKMSSLCSDLGAEPERETLLMTVHLLANPGDSLLLQHTLDQLLQGAWPGLRIFHVSERACRLRDPAPAFPGQPSLAVTLFLHEARGEKRIQRALDLLQRPPWRFHHSESRPGAFLPRCGELYVLGAGLPLWGVRPVHCGDEVLRLTLLCAFGNYGDAVRLYQLVLRRRAQEQKAGFCWFTLQSERGLSLQLALKRLPPGPAPRPCGSTLLQFRCGDLGGLVPLLPHPCTPISATRWHSHDLDGNKILLQVKGQSELCSSSLAFPLSSDPPSHTTPGSPSVAPPPPPGPCAVPGLAGGGWRLWGPPREESGGSDSCSSPPSSSCYSSQRSSPAPSFRPHSLPEYAASEAPVPPRVLGAESETDVDTGFAVESWQERPATVGSSSLETVAKDLSRWLPDMPGEAGTVASSPCARAVTSSLCASIPRGSLSQIVGGTPRQLAGGERPPPHKAQHPTLQDEFYI